MPTLADYVKEREARGEKVGDFLSQDEVNALLRGVTGETDENADELPIDEDDWAAAMAEQMDDDERQPPTKYSRRQDWETIGMSVADWRKLVELLKTQPIGEYYDIYTTIISNLPRK